MPPASPYHARIGAAASIPVPDPEPFLSYSTVTIPTPSRPVDLEMRMSFPARGTNLPIILLSHGLGRANWISSHHSYAPLSEFYAARGFVVIQPCHLDSAFLGLSNAELPWQSRASDMSTILDNLSVIEDAVPTLAGRLDRDAVATVGHSMGSYTAAMLLGLANRDPRTGHVVQARDARVKTGVVLALTGRPDALSDAAWGIMPWYGPDFTTMQAPALVVAGDKDDVPLASRGPEWFAESYQDAPAPKTLLSIAGGEHGLGGVSTWDAVETTDESPERLATVQKMTWAYLRNQLYPGDDAWARASEALAGVKQLGFTESK